MYTCTFFHVSKRAKRKRCYKEERTDELWNQSDIHTLRFQVRGPFHFYVTLVLSLVKYRRRRPILRFSSVIKRIHESVEITYGKKSSRDK